MVTKFAYPLASLETRRSRKSGRKAIAKMNRVLKSISRNSKQDETEFIEETDKNYSHKGCKPIEQNEYYFDSLQKINAWREKLKHGNNLTSTDKKRLRNQISALQSRLNKKLEVELL